MRIRMSISEAEFQRTKERISHRFSDLQAFRKHFGHRCPDSKLVRPFFSGGDAKSKLPTIRTLAIIQECLDVPNETYLAYQGLCTALSNGAQSLDECTNFVGDYFIHHATPNGGLAMRGLRLFCQHGISRFWLFDGDSNLHDFRKSEYEFYGDETSEQLCERLCMKSEVKLPNFPVKEGFFFSVDGRLLMFGAGSNYIQSIVGLALPKEVLAQTHLSVVLVGNSPIGGTSFASKAVMFHHSSSGFTNARTKEQIQILLQVDKLSEGVLYFG